MIAADPDWLERKRARAREYMRGVHRADPAAYNARIKRSYSKKRAILEADPLHPDHGKNSSYTAGCRCALCTNARRVYAREHRNRIKEEK